ncbi:MAG: tetratricopeptide repeat protein [Myxococcales bacterium]|nr:tetratricopeptide repeat protein [Myxococcales bacterium]
MDQLTAHLDRGWDLAQRGDIRGAESSARRAIELDPDSPEAYNLLGYAASLEGDSDEALEAYHQAILLDDTYVEAMLNAAELYTHALGEYDEAVELCEQILGVTDYEDEIIDTLLLKFEALLGKGDVDEAQKTLAALPSGPYEAAAQSFAVGRAHFEVGQLARAAELFDAALATEPHHGDALYYRGLLREERGDRRGATSDLLQALALERESPRPPWAPDEQAFAATVESALRSLPPELAGLVANAEVYVVDLPGAEVVVDGVDPRALALVDAPSAEATEARGEDAHDEAPATTEAESGAAPGEGSVPRVFVYALNALRAAPSLHALETELRAALEREVASAFGIELEEPEPDTAH